MKRLFVLVLIILSAASQAFAADGVRVERFSTYTSKIEGFEAKVVTPILRGLANKDLEKNINAVLWDNASKEIERYEKAVVKTLANEPKEKARIGLTSDYVIKTDNASILAFDVYVLETAGSSSTSHKFYTMDKKRHELISLKSLFRENVDYVTALSRYIFEEMRNANKKEPGAFFISDTDKHRFKQIRPDQNFYIDNAGEIVICFDKYEVAAGAKGSPEFIIPSKVIGDIRAK